MRSYPRSRKDGTHVAIRDALREVGCRVDDVSSVAGLGYDLVVWTAGDGGRRAYAVEVKDGSKRPSARRLTESELRMAITRPEHFRVVSSVGEALALMGGR